MATKISRKDLLTTDSPSGSMLYDKEFPKEIKEGYNKNNLNEQGGDETS